MRDENFCSYYKRRDSILGTMMVRYKKRERGKKYHITLAIALRGALVSMLSESSFRTFIISLCSLKMVFGEEVCSQYAVYGIGKQKEINSKTT
jgi:hypothetical protein